MGESETGENDEFSQEIKQLEEEQKKTEEEIRQLQKEDEVYKKSLQKPTIAPKHIDVKIKNEEKKKVVEAEVETTDGKKIKTKIEDAKIKKIEIEHKKLKIKYEVQKDKIVAKAEDEDGKDVELDKTKLDELEQQIEGDLEDSGIKIATGGAGKISFAKNNISATTKFPLAIAVGTNQLVVTTPAGQKVVAVLPDDAVQNMLATGVINALDEDPVGTDAGAVEFTVENNEPVYKIAGLKKFKFLGFIPVTQPVTVTVSSETGTEVNTERPFFTSIIDLLSP